MADQQNPTGDQSTPQGSAGDQSTPQGSDLLSLLNRPIADSARDPLKVLAEIFADKDISPGHKDALFLLAQRRFRHRRRMAYIALISIVASLALLFAASRFGSTWISNLDR